MEDCLFQKNTALDVCTTDNYSSGGVRAACIYDKDKYPVPDSTTLPSQGDGGAIASRGEMTISDCTFTNNTAGVCAISQY